jgi:amino acid transporter
MGIMMVVLSIFAAESLFVIFDTDTSQPFGIVLLVGFLLMFYFLIFNLVSLKLSGIFSSLTTILKFVPLLMIIIAGIVIASMNGNGGLIGTSPGSPVPGAGENAPVVGEFNFGFVIASLPSVLFAFDSFANVGNLALDIKNPKKNVPLVIVVGIILSAVFYILVTISQLFRSNGNGIDFFNDPLFAEASIALTYTIRFFILISVIGVVNSFSASSLRAFQSLISENLFFASDSVRKISSKTPFIKKYELASGFILEIIVICI